MRLLLFKKVLYNCRKATLLACKKEEVRLSLLEQLQLSYHLLYCGVCRTFIGQSKEVQRHVQAYKEQLADNPPYRLDPERKKNMEEQLTKLSKKM